MLTLNQIEQAVQYNYYVKKTGTVRQMIMNDPFLKKCMCYTHSNQIFFTYFEIEVSLHNLLRFEDLTKE